MKKILLCCSAGMSTSMLVQRMVKVVISAASNAKLKAQAVTAFEGAIQVFDVCLLGPQVRFQLEELRKTASRYGKPIDVISPMAYGMMKGEEVLDQALSLISD